MTSNQINYWRNEEEKRHNQSVEVETHRHNVRTEEISELQASAAWLTASYGAMYAQDYATAALWGASANMLTAQANMLKAEAYVGPYAEANMISSFGSLLRGAGGWSQAQLGYDRLAWDKEYGHAELQIAQDKLDVDRFNATSNFFKAGAAIGGLTQKISEK